MSTQTLSPATLDQLEPIPNAGGHIEQPMSHPISLAARSARWEASYYSVAGFLKAYPQEGVQALCDLVNSFGDGDWASVELGGQEFGIEARWQGATYRQIDEYQARVADLNIDVPPVEQLTSRKWA